jgi:predicted ATPase
LGTARIRTPDRRLRVFISSTLGELADEREAARRSVEQLRLTPIMFELGARPHPPRVLYRSYLDQSDVFVGIYWQRYGWVAPGMEISGLEDEFVLSSGMPRLVYVKRPAPDMEPRLKEMLARLEDEGSAAYKPFGDARELHDLLLDDLAVLLTERFESSRTRSAAGWRASNLPAATSTFLGREEALERLGGLLADEAVRLVTLTGPGGTGKTRLALEAARAQLGRFGDGVFFVDLSAERRPDEVFAAIARALGIGGDAEGSALEALERDLRDRQVLLVLDNFEQVVSAGVGVVRLLEGCPFLKVLVTSREALRLSVERVFLVPPLTLPDADQAAVSVEAVLQSEAGRLFYERAAAVGSGFTLNEGNVADVVAICRRLDGLPLALELAAARVRFFGVAELREELETHHEVLTGGARDLPERQQTLRKTIEWSYELLGEVERTMFALFSVFSDAQLADVEDTVRRALSPAGIDVVEALSSLVDKSLVRVIEGADGRPRFSMLQTIREHARERLDAAPDLAMSVRQAHADHYTEVALGLRRRLTYADRSDVLVALGGDLANLRSAWDHWVRHAETGRLGELLEPLWGYYDARGDYRSATVLGEDFLRVLSRLPETPERRYDEFAVQTNLARTNLAVRGFTPEAERMIREALDRFESVGDTRQRFSALRSLASLQLMRNQFERTGPVADDLMDIAEQESDPVLLAEAHLLSGLRTGWLENLAIGIEHAEKAITYFETRTSGFVEFRVGPNPGVIANAVAGLFRWMAGFAEGAAARIEDSVRLAQELDHPPSTAFALHHANLLDLWRLDAPSVASRSEDLLRLADAHGYPIWRALALVFHGTASVAMGKADGGLAEIEEGFALYNECSTPPVFFPAVLGTRATAYGMAGHIERALALLGEAEANVRPDEPLAANIAMAKGDFLLALPSPEVTAAEASFELAATNAGSRGARMVELEALTRLAALHGDGSPHPNTAHRLRRLYDTFTEGFDSPPLVAARAHLDENG